MGAVAVVTAGRHPPTDCRHRLYSKKASPSSAEAFVFAAPVAADTMSDRRLQQVTATNFIPEHPHR